MLRIVLAVVLATALLGVSQPVIEDARRDHTETAIRTEIQRVERAATDLLDEDDPTSGDGARRVVTITLPAESWTDAGIGVVTFKRSRDGQGGRVTWALDHGPVHVRHLPAIPLRSGSNGPFTLQTPGRHRLVLTLDGASAAPLVTIRQFTSDDVATGFHA